MRVDLLLHGAVAPAADFRQISCSRCSVSDMSVQNGQETSERKIVQLSVEVTKSLLAISLA